MELTDTTIRGAKAREKSYKLRDGQGLHLLIKPNGARLWRLRYEFEGVEKGISLGIYPDVSLKQARSRRDAARKLIAEGIDPSAKRKADKLAVAESFELVTREWLTSLARPRNRDAIERQLAHDERDESRASYNHAQYLAERRKMMQAWADYLETLRSARTPALVDNSTTLQAAHPRAA